MTTTIQLQEETQDILKQLRKSLHAETYDDVINKLISRPVNLNESLFGFLGKKTRKEILKGLRDDKDRI